MQRGAGTLLLIAVLVPVLFYGTTLVLSLYQVNSRRGDLQSNLEQALMKGARYLPDANEAMRITKEELKSKFGEGIRIIEKHKSSYSMAVSLQYTTQRKLRIPLVKSEREIKVSESAQARITAQPKDVYIFFENSSYLAPPISKVGTDDAFFWGQSVKRNTFDGKWTRRDEFGYFDTFIGVTKAKLIEYHTRGEYEFSTDQNGLRSLMSIITPHWQAADLFKDPTLRPNRLRSALRTDDALKQVVFTQACFNPILSALKKATIHLYDNFSISPLNRIAVESGPISGAPPNLNRLGIASNAGEVFTIQAMLPGGDPLRTGQANLENNRGEKISMNANIEANHRLRVRDQECWSAFEIATRRWLVNQQQSFLGSGEVGKTIYAIPKLPNYVVNAGVGNVGVNIPSPILRERMYGSRYHYELDRGSINNLRTREAIWSRSVAEDYSDETRTGHDTINFQKIITGIITKLVNAETPDNLSNLRKLAGNALEKRAYILLGDTPHLNLGGQSLDNLRTAEEKNLKDQYFNILKSQLTRLKDAMRGKPGRLRVFIVIPRHEGSYSQRVCTKNWREPGELICSPFKEHMVLLRDEISSLTNSWGNVDVTTIPATDVGTLALDLVSSLISSGQNYVLSDV
jgi:hypothetical protein